ncbi:MAG: aldo/keto reductase [Planctomycetaceae bacterium]|jgi:aryl-alcohol dehydrogenase-like predicted oxidoreductase|nr:aldo/keto reductase [Planctomycetaceae bacterium]
MKRRDFLEIAALAGGTLAATSLTVSDSLSDEAVLGSSAKHSSLETQITKEVKSSRIGFGTGMRGVQRQSDLTRAGWTKGIELLRFAYDRGIRLFDCADCYGTHFVVAEALKDKHRDSYVLVSKVWLRPGNLPELERLPPHISVRRFLKELRTDYIDILQLHCIDSGKWTTELAEAMESMEQLKQKGIIRAHGISSHSNASAEVAAETNWCDVVHVRINGEGMNMDGAKEDAVKRVEEGVRITKKIHDAGKGVIAMKVLGEGKMAHDPGMRKRSTRFVAGLDSIDVMIAGFTEKEHITEFIDNVYG